MQMNHPTLLEVFFSGEGLPTLRSIQEIAKELTISDWKEIVLEVYDAFILGKIGQ
jgi:hypothetical protein